MRAAFLAAFSLSPTQRAGANIFYLKDQWSGNDFYHGWNWETIDDPTRGRVNYVSLEEAQSKNLTSGTPFRTVRFLRSPFGSIAVMPTHLFFFSGGK
jgi:hypothetical protein